MQEETSLYTHPLYQSLQGELQKANQDKDEIVIAARNEIYDMQQKLSQSQKEVSTLKTEKERAHNKCASCRAVLKQRTKEGNYCEQPIQARSQGKTEFKPVSQNFCGKGKEMSARKTKTKGDEEGIKKYKELVQHLTSENESLSLSVEDCKEKLRIKIETIEALNKKVCRLKEQHLQTTPLACDTEKNNSSRKKTNLYLCRDNRNDQMETEKPRKIGITPTRSTTQKQKEYEVLKKENDNLQKEIVEIKKVLNKARQETNEFSQKTQRAQKDLNAEKLMHKKTKESCNAQLADLTLKLKHLEHDNRTLKDLKKARVKCDENAKMVEKKENQYLSDLNVLKQKLKTAESERQHFCHELESLKGRDIEDRTLQERDLKTLYKTFEVSIRAFKRENQQELQNYEKECTKLEKANTTLKEQLMNQDKEITEYQLKTENNQKTNEIRQQKHQAETLKLKARIDELTEEIHFLKNRKKKLTTMKITRYMNDRSQENSIRIKEFTSEMEKLQTKYSLSENQIIQLEQQLENMKQREKRLMDEADQLKKMKVGMESQIAEATKQLKEAKLKETKQLKKELAELERANREMTEKFKKSELQRSEAAKSLEKIQQQMQEERLNFQESKALLKNETVNMTAVRKEILYGDKENVKIAKEQTRHNLQNEEKICELENEILRLKKCCNMKKRRDEDELDFEKSGENHTKTKDLHVLDADSRTRLQKITKELVELQQLNRDLLTRETLNIREIETLRAAVEDKNSECFRLRQELSNAEERANEEKTFYEKQLKSLNDQLREVTKERQNIQGEVNHVKDFFKDEIQSLKLQHEQKIKDLLEDNSRLKEVDRTLQSELENIKAVHEKQNEALQDKIKYLEIQREELEKEKDASNYRVNKMKAFYEKQKESFDDRLLKAKTDRESIDEDMIKNKERWDNIIQGLKLEHEQKFEKLLEDNRRLDKAEQTLKTQQQKVDAAHEKEREALQNEIRNVENKRKELQTEKNASEQRVKDLFEENSRLKSAERTHQIELQNMQAAHEKENEALQNKMKYFEKRGKELEKEKNESNQRLIHCQSQIDSLSDQLSEMNRENDRLDSETRHIKHDLETEKNSMKQQWDKAVRELKKENKNLQTENSEHAKRIESLQTALEEKIKQNENITRELKDSKESYTKLMEEYESKTKRLQGKLASVRNKKGGRDQEMTMLRRQFEDEIHTLKGQFKEKIDSLETINDELHKENAAYEKETNTLQAKIQTYTAEIMELRQELDDAKTRLSKLMGQKLTDNNPNIADLSDQNRPTKLAERFTELYDNQWTDAFEILDNGNEKETIGTLFKILKNIVAYCSRKAEEQMETLKSTLLISKKTGDSVPTLLRKQLKDCRKASASESERHIFQAYVDDLRNSDGSLHTIVAKVPTFVEECCRLSWLMCLQDPPVVLGPAASHGEAFRSEVFKAYTRSGPRVDYEVWPSLLLHEGGSLLSKGVAQGSK